MVSAGNAAIQAEGGRAVLGADGNMQTEKGNSGESAMKREPVKVYPDGREVCTKLIQGKRLYSDRTYAMSRRQGFRCAICHRVFSRADEWTFDHQNGRGLGGAIRDDRIEIDGKWFNAALCVTCQSMKGSKRYHWVKENGQMKYVPQTANPA